MGMVYHWYRSNQDYSKSGFARKHITPGPNILIQNIKVTYDNDIPWGGSRLLKIWIRRKYDYTGRHYLHPEHEDYIRE